MAIGFSFKGTVDDKTADEFEFTEDANQNPYYEMRPGDMVRLKSRETGKIMMFTVTQRIFDNVADEDGNVKILIVLDDPLEDLFSE